MLPLYQDKKKQFFATLKTKFKNNKKTFLKNKSNKKATGYFGSFFIFLLFLFFYELKHFFITFEWNNIEDFSIYPNKKELYFLILWPQTRSLPNSIYFFIDHSSK